MFHVIVALFKNSPVRQVDFAGWQSVDINKSIATACCRRWVVSSHIHSTSLSVCIVWFIAGNVNLMLRKQALLSLTPSLELYTVRFDALE